MRYTWPLLFLFLCLGALGQAQVSLRYSFFRGDTLQGFNIDSVFRSESQKPGFAHLNVMELKTMFYRKERSFVNKKFGIAPSPLLQGINPASIGVLTAGCNNLDFESGTFAGWIGAVGFNNNSNAPFTIASNGISTLGLNSPEPSCSYHTLVSAPAGNDPYSGQPMLDVGGGTYACRLGGEFLNIENTLAGGFGIGPCSTGDTSGTLFGSGAESLQETFVVTPNNNLLNYSYSVVMDQVIHGFGEQPYFRVEVLDSLGNPTQPCHQFYVQEDSLGNAPPGFITSNVLDASSDSVYYLPWSQNAVNLSTYMGRQITIRFSAAGCIYGGHFAYGYIDCSCSPLQLFQSSAVACVGHNMTLSAPPGATSYQWTEIPPGTGIVGSSTGSTVQIAQNGKYQVVVTNGACSYTIDTTLTFLLPPIFTAKGFNGVGCGLNSHDSAVVTVTGGPGPYTYSWNTVPALTTASISNVASGTYTATITASDGCIVDTVLTISQTALINLAAVPAKTICLSQSTPLTATASGGSAPYTYSWTIAGGGAVTSPVSPVANTIYTVVANDATGCFSSPQTFLVDVRPKLNVIATGATSICLGDSALLHSSATGGDSIYTYTWIPALGLNSATIQNPLAKPIATTIYTIVVTDGCGTPADSAKVTVTLFPILTNPVILASDTNNCVPYCVTFSETASQPCANAIWNFGNGAGTGCGPVQNCYNQPGAYTVSVNIVDANGCKASSTRTNYIQVNPLPVAAFYTTPSPVTIENARVNFINQSTGAVSWSWMFGDTLKSASVLENPSFTYQYIGCYEVILAVQSTAGCRDTLHAPVCIQDAFEFYVPNAFTPNGDGKNDVWTPYGEDIDPNNYQVDVFDRWGNNVFSTTVLGKGWDGTYTSSLTSQIDTYVWKVSLKDNQGNRHNFTGLVNLIK